MNIFNIILMVLNKIKFYWKLSSKKIVDVYLSVKRWTYVFPLYCVLFKATYICIGVYRINFTSLYTLASIKVYFFLPKHIFIYFFFYNYFHPILYLTKDNLS